MKPTPVRKYKPTVRLTRRAMGQMHEGARWMLGPTLHIMIRHLEIVNIFADLNNNSFDRSGTYQACYL
jgi:hypothetical protein